MNGCHNIDRRFTDFCIIKKFHCNNKKKLQHKYTCTKEQRQTQLCLMKQLKPLYNHQVLRMAKGKVKLSHYRRGRAVRDTGSCGKVVGLSGLRTGHLYF
jgi:hypothetical protein